MNPSADYIFEEFDKVYSEHLVSRDFAYSWRVATLLTHDDLPKMALNDLKLPSKDPLVYKIKF